MEHSQNHLLTTFNENASIIGPFASYDAMTKIIGIYDDATLQQFGAFQGAFNFFNERFFGSKLSPVILTLDRKAKALGYYRSSAWFGANKEPIPEININPSTLRLPAKEVMATLVHEMCHHYQYLFGVPGSSGYHNREFSRIMFSVGLMCSDTGMPGGKITGRKMSDYAIEAGLFEIQFALMPKEFILPFKPFEHEFSRNAPNETSAVNSCKKNQTKYSCAVCRAIVWGKPQLKLMCMVCYKELHEAGNAHK